MQASQVICFSQPCINQTLNLKHCSLDGMICSPSQVLLVILSQTEKLPVHNELIHLQRSARYLYNATLVKTQGQEHQSLAALRHGNCSNYEWYGLYHHTYTNTHSTTKYSVYITYTYIALLL